MFKIFVALATIIVVARGQISQKDIDSEWDDYLKNQSLTKSTDEKINAEAKARFAKVHDRIQKHNKDSKSSYKMGHNFFSHMTDDQMSDFYGLTPAVKLKETSHTNSGKNFLIGETSISSKAAEMRQAPLPSSVDYRGDKCMQPIKNQKHCGSCYAFSAVAVFEFAYCRVKDEAVSFSEQQIVDCFGRGCNGGRPEEALDFIANNSPFSKSSDYSYTSGGFFRTLFNLIDGKPGKCKIKPKNLPRFFEQSTISGPFKNRVALMKRILSQNGVLDAALRITKNLNSYKSGVFSVEPCDTGLQHAVVIVGYNDDTAIPYWIVRNSWGTGWGINGYMYIRSGANICGIEQFLSTFITKLDKTLLLQKDYPSFIQPSLGDTL